jgi:hypothetical protein
MLSFIVIYMIYGFNLPGDRVHYNNNLLVTNLSNVG